MERADNGAFEKTPNVLNRIGVNVTAHPFFEAVVDRLMLGIMVANAMIGRPLIGDDTLSRRVNMLIDKCAERLPTSVFHNLQPDFTLSLDGPHYYGLLPTVPATNPLLHAYL